MVFFPHCRWPSPTHPETPLLQAKQRGFTESLEQLGQSWTLMISLKLNCIVSPPAQSTAPSTGLVRSQLLSPWQLLPPQGKQSKARFWSQSLDSGSMSNTNVFPVSKILTSLFSLVGKSLFRGSPGYRESGCPAGQDLLETTWGIYPRAARSPPWNPAFQAPDFTQGGSSADRVGLSVAFKQHPRAAPLSWWLAFLQKKLSFFFSSEMSRPFLPLLWESGNTM